MRVKLTTPGSTISLAAFLLLIALQTSGGGKSPQSGSRPFQVGIAYGTAGKRDGSYSEAAARGIVQAKKDPDVHVKEVEPTQLSDLDPALVELSRGGSDLIIAVGFYYSDAIMRVAPRFPKTRYVIIDGDVKGPPNVLSILFREEQGSFLVGALAGLATRSNVIGVVVASDIPILNKFVAGYRCGAQATNPGVRFERPEYIGSGPDAFNDVLKGAEHARLLIARGADVIYHVAGRSGIGVIDAARENGHIYAIGADSPQHDLAPTVVLTSMLKRVDLAVLEAIQNTRGGTPRAGRIRLGLESNGTNYVDYEQDNLIRPDWEAKVNKLREAIRVGQLSVPEDFSKPCSEDRVGR